MEKKRQGCFPSHLWARHPQGIREGLAATDYIEWFHPCADQWIETAHFFPELTSKLGKQRFTILYWENR
ncbi:hypothetical protein [Listeria grayi]|uniref:hypothetical protein n=1 Tax=Listeria grayi TaxID=1641 RepID=UPI0016270734|nr:hypothetical protein [Listeria grayi]MBC1922994.1 hypothetical protein [Listeria grayi]